MDAQAPQQPSIDPLEALPVAGRDLASLLPWPARGDGGGRWATSEAARGWWWIRLSLWLPNV